MPGYPSATVSNVHLVTQRLVVRLAIERDAWLLSDYYAENSRFLKPWEPTRDQSHYYPSAWQIRLSQIKELHRQASAFHFIILDPAESEIRGVITFSQILRGAFHACYLGYSLAEKYQGKGMMQEALQATIRYMQQHQHIHRIMASYMPHNHRSGQLLTRLGFEKEGYAKNYLLIDGEWQDHVLTALTTPGWTPKKGR